jgi:hypothetical protein
MSSAAIGLICGVVGHALFLILHIGALSFQRNSAPWQTMVRILFATTMATMLAVAVLLRDRWAGLLLAETYAVLVMACLFVVSAPLFFTIYTSLSVESLLIAFRRGGSVSIETLYRRFASPEFVSGRLETMVMSGYLVSTGDRYQASPKGRRVAAFFSAIKRTLRLGLGG